MNCLTPARGWDGGYVIAGIIGHGDAFIMRDVNGIRPAWYYADDEIVVAASERAVIQTVMKLPEEEIAPVKPGHALIVKKNGTWSEEMIKQPGRISFMFISSVFIFRGAATGKSIMSEKNWVSSLYLRFWGYQMNGELENSVFSFIPNTSETAFYGMIKGVETYMLESKR